MHFENFHQAVALVVEMVRYPNLIDGGRKGCTSGEEVPMTAGLHRQCAFLRRIGSKFGEIHRH